MTTYQILTAVSTLIILSLCVNTFKLWKVKSVRIFSLLMFFASIFISATVFRLNNEDIALVLLWINTCLIAFWSLFRYQPFSIIPIARDKIMDSIQEGIIVVDEYGRVVDINAAIDGFVTDIFGGKQEISGKSIDLLLSSWPQWLSACKDMKADEFEIDATISGGNRYFRVKVYPLCKKNIKMRGTVSILFEITESKLREDELISSSEWSKEQLKDQTEELMFQKKQLEAIFENMSDHCVVVDSTGRYIKVNKAAKEFIPSIKISQVGDWLKSAKYYDAMGNEIHSGTIPAARVIHGEAFSNYRLIVKICDHEVHFDVNGTPVYDDKGVFLFGIVCSHDVTELVRQEQELKLHNKQLETIINTISDMAVLTIADKEGNIIYYNNSANSYFFKNIYETKLGSTYRKGVFFNIDGSEIEYSELTGIRVLRGEKVSNFHFVMKDSGEEKHFLSNGTPVFDNDGNLKYGVFFTLDITEQVLHKRLIPEMEQLAALNALKDKLFTIVTHDIRNPMATLVSMMELFGDEKEHCCDYQEIIASVREQVKNTYAMVENLLDWFRTQKDNLIFSPLTWDLSIIACEAVNVYRNNAEAKKIQVTNNIGKDITIFADKNMLEVVLRNLIHNAIKYSPNGGTITLQAKASENKVIVSVRDNGVGIAFEKAKTIFDEATTRSTTGTAGEKGTGLGLLICKEFVERNGGELWLESIPGEGSTFYFSLRASEQDRPD